MSNFGWNRVFLAVAFVLFLLATLVAAGIITMSGAEWLTDGGLAALALAMLV